MSNSSFLEWKNYLPNPQLFYLPPIIDRSVPTEKQTIQIKELAKKLVEKVNQNEKIIVHCRGGIGRAGMLCSAILIEQEIKPQEAIEKISEARGVTIPDTEEQKRWIMRY